MLNARPGWHFGCLLSSFHRYISGLLHLLLLLLKISIALHIHKWVHGSLKLDACETRY